MKIVVIHGQSHRGVTYHMTCAVLDHIRGPKDIRTFFLPADGPDCCVGCNQCFLKGEEHCPQADKVRPIMTAMEEADLIVLTSPNYCMEMSGAMKVLLDHFAYRWVTHRPHGAMFTKVGLTVSSSAGAPANHTTKSLAKQLRWMGVAKGYQFPLVCHAMGVPGFGRKDRGQNATHGAAAGQAAGTAGGAPQAVAGGEGDVRYVQEDAGWRGRRLEPHRPTVVGGSGLAGRQEAVEGRGALR